ncbi:MAG: hypothetical protein Q9227_005940 [Pyrenula ochraceoflavens]
MSQSSSSPLNSSPRTVIHLQNCQTIAYPSVGGIVLGHFSAVELSYLNLPRFHNTDRSSDPAEEDDLALRMLSLGAHWWPSYKLYARHIEEMNDVSIPYEFHFPPNVKVAYPSSGNGVWVLKFSADWPCFDDEYVRARYLPGKPDKWEERVGMCLSMDDRCEVLKGFGAKFYGSPGECEDLLGTIEEAVERGRVYEALLKKMEDLRYVAEWREWIKESYEQSEESYEQSEESYEQSEESYEQSEESYEQSEESYEQSEESYEQIEGNDQQIEETYEQSDDL